MVRRSLFWRVLLAALMALAPLAARAQEPKVLRMAGTGAGLALIRQLGDAFLAVNPGVQIRVPESIGTSGAIRGVATGRLEVGVLARPPKAGEMDGARWIELCRTPLTFYTSASRQDVTLLRRDLPDLFRHTLPPFRGGEVRMLLRPDGEAEFIRLLEIFPELVPALAAARAARGAAVALTVQDALSAVEGSRSLVGFGALTPILAEKRRLVAIPLDGVLAGGGGPPVAGDMPLVLAAGPNAPAEAMAFLDFASGPVAAAVLRSNGCQPSAGGRP